MKQIFIPAFIAILFLNANAQNKSVNVHVSDAKLSERFDDYIKNALQLWKPPGLSIVVVKDKQVVFKKAYGLRELGKQEPFTTSTLSICASTTKAMTAVCMGMLVDEGKIKWTTKVSDVYPAFKLY